MVARGAGAALATLAVLVLGCVASPGDSPSEELPLDDSCNCDPGPVWPSRHLEYELFVSYRLQFGDDGGEAARRAFAQWEDAGNLGLTFEEADGGQLGIGIYEGDHGDACPFLGEGGVAAHAFDAGHGTHPGEIHLDGDEDWYLGGALPGAGQLDLQTVLAHEIGHLLGLCHINTPEALMNAAYEGTMREITDEDVAALVELYEDWE